jgi:osmotically-inducible protein OsmY
MNKIIVLLLCLTISACAAWNKKGVKVSPYDRRAEKIITTDSDIESDSHDALNDNKELLAGGHIIINSYNKSVLLTGEVLSVEAKEKVVELIRVIKPVKQVYDYLSLAPASDFSSRTTDALITKNVTQAFKQIHGLPNFNPAVIKVITTRGIVYLMGIVHRDEGSVVINLSRLQTGVKGIVTLFEYLD